jgi:hypothetical protein
MIRSLVLSGLVVFLGRGDPMHAQDVISANTLSYVDRHLVEGSNFVSSPLRVGDPSVSNVFRDLPAGSYVARWDEGLRDFGEINMRVEGAGWTDGAAEMGMGQGAVVWVSAAHRISWAGSLVPAPCVRLPAGPTVTSVVPVHPCGPINVTDPSDPGFPCLFPFDGPGAPVSDGATIRYWDPALQQYGVTYLYIDGLGWLDASSANRVNPMIAPGHAVRVEVDQPYDYCQLFNLGPAESAYAVPLIQPARSGTQFSVQVESQGNVEYCLRRTPRLGSRQWEVVHRVWGPPGGGLLSLIDHDASDAMAFYRVDCLWLSNPSREGDTFSFQFEAEEGYAYEVQQTANPGQPFWVVVQVLEAPPGGGRVTATDTSAMAATGHYRLVQRPL